VTAPEAGRPQSGPGLVSYARSPRDPRIGWIQMNRPAQRNAIDTAMAEALREAVTTFECDPVARVAILAGAGPVFCAGMDLAAFARGERPGLEDADGFAYFVRRRRTKPLIAAVQGGAYAGGFEIMLACDLALATSGARFALPEAGRGIIAAGGGGVRLPHRIPLVIAREMLLTGDPITAERAFALGLLNAVVPPDMLDEAAETLARRIADNAPLSVTASLTLCQAGADTLEAAGWSESARLWDQVAGSDDAREGALAFVENRQPDWQGR